MGFFGSSPSRRKAGSIPSLVCFFLVLICPISMAAGVKTAGDYFVRGLPGAPAGPPLKMHAGHIEVDSQHDGHLFFWHFQNRHIANKQRTVIWLNGGPGCSSMDGALMEVGPYRATKDGNLRYNNGSWDEFTNLLFIDNPIGTGFSYASTDSYLHELDEMAKQFVVFLTEFFRIFPEYEMDDLYIAGESYAGQYIPYAAKAILDRNREKSRSVPWNLRGLLIGNGWIAPTEQYMSFLPFSYKENLLQGGSGTAKKIEAQQTICNSKMNGDGHNVHIEYAECEKVMTSILSETRDKSGDKDHDCLNMYDVRLRDSNPSCGMNWPPDLKDITPYLRRKDVLAALHVDENKQSGWTECSGEVGKAFKAKGSKPAVHLLPELLSELRIVLFSGAKDLICNHVGTEDLIHNMEWNGGKGFEISPGTWAPKRDWTFEDDPAGIWQEARNLTYVLFYNASHMVPFDFPRRTRDMLDRFIEVDIASIGGAPADSRIDGEKGLETSVGGHPNSTLAQENEEKKLEQAAKSAYWTSAEVAAFFIFLILVGFGIYFCYVRQHKRKQHIKLGYQGLGGDEAGSDANLMNGSRGLTNGGGPLGALRGAKRRQHPTDLEAADFDENQLDDLTASGKSAGDVTTAGDMGRERYSIGSTGSSDSDRRGESSRHGDSSATSGKAPVHADLVDTDPEPGTGT